jgi:hypothetical protein
MPAPPRFLPPGYLTLVSSRTEEGLPFVCTAYMALIIKSILARAQRQFDVVVCAVLFMANHFHMLVVTEDPETTVAFVDRIKTELAHAVNRLLGRRRQTVWCDGYDAEPILTYTSAIEKFVYLYTNPQAANLVDTIDVYPGFSSWEMFVKDETTFGARWIQRFFFTALAQKAVSARQDEALCVRLTERSKSEHVFTLSPFAWLKCFGLEYSSVSAVKAEIMEKVRAEEARLRAERKASCVGIEQLRRQPIDLSYTPKKFGRKQWCICDDVELRKRFIAWVKELRNEARAVFARWKLGDRSVAYPPGMFPPSFPKTSNIVPALVFGRLA